ncbi:MAG: PQQ-binding-like beta-propeller repeat protein [Candidatus Coatesbacteria bacterium]|nr:MAG: PQQ-binding-like beta-propeller repeat protein [Candidatus Coatesbacteria bacterium]
MWDTDVHAAAAPPVYYDGTVIIASADKHLRAFYGETGDKLWDVRFKAPLTFAPAAADGLVYVTVLHPENKLFCLDAVTGKRLWSAGLNDHATAPAAVTEGVVVGAGDFVILFDSDGMLIEKVKTDSTVDAVYGVPGGILLIYVTGEVAVYGSDLGSVVTKGDIGLGRAYPLPSEDGVLFTGYNGEAVMAAGNFDVVWTVRLPGRVMSPAVRWNGGYLVGYMGGGVIRLSAEGGIEWSVSLDANVRREPVVTSDGAFVLTETGIIYAIDGDGSIAEFARLDFKSTCGLLYYEGKLLAIDDEGKVSVYTLDGD